MSFILAFINLLLQWYVWLPIVAILAYLTWRNYQKVDIIKEVESSLLILEIPKANDKSELAAEQMFASLHGILRDAKELKRKIQAAQYVAAHPGEVCPAKWTPGDATLAPSLDLVGKI